MTYGSGSEAEAQNAELSGGEAVRSDSLLAEAFTAIRALVQELSCYTSVNGADEDDEQALALGRDVLSKANDQADSSAVAD